MSEPIFPISVAVRRPDGSVEQVRVGSAERVGDGYSIKLGELSIGATPDRSATRATGPAGAVGEVFPPYGRSKGAPIRGASQQDLEYYAAGCHRTLNDPSKARFHEKEKLMLAAIEAEVARQAGQSPSGASSSSGGSAGEPPPLGDDDAPF